MRNNLKKYDLKKIEEVLVKYGYSLNSRAEEIPVSVFESSELNLFYNSDFVLKSGISIPANLLEKATDLK